MRKNGVEPPKGPFKYVAHHIVPALMAGYDKIRTILDDAGVKINSYLNGVWLEASYHAKLHSAQYVKLLESKLKVGMTQQQVIRALEETRVMLQKGWKP